MVSLAGDGQHNLYVNPQGAYGSDQQWYGDVGLGYRWIKNDAAILGWYYSQGIHGSKNGNNQLNNIILLPLGIDTGITSNNASNILISGSQIGSSTNPYTRWLNLLNVSNASITDDTVEATLIGLNILNSTSVNVDNSIINVNGANAAGVIGADSQINLSKGVITVTSNAAMTSAGISSLSNSSVTADDMQITVTNNGTGSAFDLFTFTSG